MKLPILILALALFMTACTETYRPKIETNITRASVKSDASVQLVLTPEFTAWQGEFGLVGGRRHIEFGPALTAHSDALCREMFSSVTAVESPREGAFDFRVTPRAVAFAQTIGVMAWDESRSNLTVEWNVTDPAGQVVWIRTITGTAASPSGNSFSWEKHRAQRHQAMFDDLYQKSMQAFSESPMVQERARRTSTHTNKEK